MLWLLLRQAPHRAETADAGQFYEQVQPKMAIQCVKNCLDTVRSTSGVSTVTEVAGRGVSGKLGGQAPDFIPRTRKIRVFRFSELLQWFTLVIQLSLVRFLDVVFFITHTPIGNPFGKISVSATAGWFEYVWLSRDLHKNLSLIHI